MDILGVLGESAVITQGTITAYTVPAGKTARIRLQYRGAAGTNSVVRVLINGMEIFRSGALTATNIVYSTTALIINTAANDAAINGSTTALTVAPYGTEYFLNENDTVQYVIATADMASFNFQVVGVQLDK